MESILSVLMPCLAGFIISQVTFGVLEEVCFTKSLTNVICRDLRRLGHRRGGLPDLSDLIVS